ncbi:hypothetical protein JST97_02770 [bacterium]|nr:hypothetical protein [bacterium]
MSHPIEITPEKLALVPTELLTSETSVDYRELRQAFLARLDSTEDEELGPPLHFLACSCEFILQIDKTEVFLPVMSDFDSEGKLFPVTPAPEHWTIGSYEALGSILHATHNPALLARFGDLIVTQLKSGKLCASAAAKAVEGYQKLTICYLEHPTQSILSSHYCQRALQLAKNYGLSAKVRDLLVFATSVVADSQCHPQTRIEYARAIRKGARVKDSSVISSLLEIVEYYKKLDEWQRARVCLKEARRHAGGAQISTLLVEEARLYELEASARSAKLAKVGLLKFAIDLYRKAGKCDVDIDRIHRKVLELERLSTSEFMTFKAEQTFDLSVFLEGQDRLTSFRGCLLHLAKLLYQMLPTEADSRKEAEDNLNRFLGLSLFGRIVVDFKGRQTTAEHQTKEERVTAESFEQATHKMGVLAQIIVAPLLKRAYRRFRPEAADVVPIVMGDHIPDHQKRQWLFALLLGIQGHYTVAGPLLAPLIENFFRETVEAAGGIVSSISEDGVQDVYPLEHLLRVEADRLRTKLGEVVFFVATAAFFRSGWNYRNKTAHGLCTDGNVAGTESIFMVGFGVLICLLPVVEDLIRKHGSSESD